MIKSSELADSSSCLNRAAPDEYLFVLLGRDVALLASASMSMKCKNGRFASSSISSRASTSQ